MDNDRLVSLQDDVKNLKKSMKEIQVKQIVNNDTLDKLTTEIVSMNKKQNFFHKHYIILIGLSTICLVVLILLCHMHHMI